jgi:hypothetical protein
VLARVEQALRRVDSRHAKATRGRQQRRVPCPPPDVHDALTRSGGGPVDDDTGGRQ